MKTKRPESAASKALRQLAAAGYVKGTLEQRIAELVSDRDVLEATVQSMSIEPIKQPAEPEPAAQPAAQAEQHRFAIDRADGDEAKALRAACEYFNARPRDLGREHTAERWCFAVKPRARSRIKGAA